MINDLQWSFNTTAYGLLLILDYNHDCRLNFIQLRNFSTQKFCKFNFFEFKNFSNSIINDLQWSMVFNNHSILLHRDALFDDVVVKIWRHDNVKKFLLRFPKVHKILYQWRNKWNPYIHRGAYAIQNRVNYQCSFGFIIWHVTTAVGKRNVNII